MVAVADVQPEPQLRVDQTRTPSPGPLMASPRENGEEIGGPIVDTGGSNKHLSCAACSLTGKLRYPPGPQAPPPNVARAGKRPPSRLRYAAAAAGAEASGALTGGAGQSPGPDIGPPSLAPDSYRSSATSGPRSSPRSPATPPGTNATTNTTTTCSYHDASGRAFRLNFDSSGGAGPDPSIKCAIDHLDKDLALDLTLQRHPSDSKFSLDCFNPSDPHNHLKLKVEIFKTSSRGFGLRIIQSLPKASSPTGTSTPSLDDSKSSPKRRGDSTSPLVSSLTNSSSSSNGSSTNRSRESTKNNSSTPRIKDLSEFDEVRMSSGQQSKADVNELDHDHCYCTSPCGAPQCKAQLDDKPQEIQELQEQAG